ncbi:MAG: sulfur reduction protein DsrE [Proteobacteria bacterium]|nr:MAG: sulfur reduction protein DsrE [Pseudomonadota bacterium]
MKRLSLITTTFALALTASAGPASAAEPAWVNPAIADFGAVVSLPEAGMQPSTETDYKVVFNVTGGGGNDKVNPSLDRVARAVNVFASAGVPLSRLHFVAVIHGPATSAVLDNEHYKEKFSLDNPNTKLISELKTAGVKVVVCGQALANNKFPHDWVNRDVEITLAAISDVIILEQHGYVLFPM